MLTFGGGLGSVDLQANGFATSFLDFNSASGAAWVSTVTTPS